MTAHPIDTEALRARAEHVYHHGGPPNAIESLAANIPEILDRLAAAEHERDQAVGTALTAQQALDQMEHRATRAEAQSAIRGRAVAIYQDRARTAEARLAGWMEHWNATARTGAVDEVAAILEANARADRAEARIKAVQDLIDQADTAGDWTVICTHLQWAIDGTNPNPYRTSETA